MVAGFNDHEYDYLIPRTDGSIIVGGARRDYYHQLDSWFGVHNDSQLMDKAEHYFDGSVSSPPPPPNSLVQVSRG